MTAGASRFDFEDRRIPLELRAQVTAWMAKHRKRGDSWSELVRQTGVSMLTLQRWSSSPPRHAVMLRRVEVAEAARAERTVMLVSPTGMRIEGLTIADVVAIPASIFGRGTTGSTGWLTNIPSLEEAERVVSFILNGETKLIAGKVTQGTPLAETLREYLALTIAVVGAAEQLYRTVGRPYPDQWESLERSAETFMDHFVVTWLAEGDPELKRAVIRHRRRKLAAHRGVLRLVESDRAKRARWVAVTLPQDAPIPITEEVGKAWAS